MPQPTKAPLLYRESDETDWQPASFLQVLVLLVILVFGTFISIIGLWHLCYYLLRWVA